VKHQHEPATGAAAIIGLIAGAAHPLNSAAPDYAELMDAIGDARLVLIGEASHGTHEFYRERARLTRQLIAEKGFSAVAVEADWPAAYRVNCFVRGAGEDGTASEALDDFRRFPTWMWRNADVLDFVGWLREHNAGAPQPVGFYGLDLYSLRESMEAVLNYLDEVDPEAARRARYRYSCFDQFGEDPQAYGYAAAYDLTQPCEREAVSQLVEMQRRVNDLARRDGGVAEDEAFYAEQNARLVKNAEAYYRSMFEDGAASWNLRDQHMAETLSALLGHLSRVGQPARAVVWAHNSHLGDARATEMAERGEHNLGQLVREQFGRAAFLLGFSTYTGTVSAARDWGGRVERRQVRPATSGSYEHLFHAVGQPWFWLDLRGQTPLAAALRPPRLERAIGVIYRPETERLSHYFHARLPDQFDAVIHIDTTRAVDPLEPDSEWVRGETPETFPTGI
jgi:erythromycin esterase-like protein